MDALTAIGTVLGIAVSALTIIGMFGRKTETITTIKGSFDKEGKFYPGPITPPPLPLSEEEFEKQMASMPIEWVTYAGTTPPLKLKIRGVTEMMYIHACRKYINAIGQEEFERLPDGRGMVRRAVNSGLYVVDWEGARYPNGNPIPFSPSALSVLLAQDPYLDNFLSDEILRISPK